MTAPREKVAKESVLHEHRDGRPHITVDEHGAYRHYCGGGPREGEVMRPVFAGMIRLTPGRQPPAPSVSSGSSKVVSEAFRAGWDAIDWSHKGRSEPS